MTVLGDYLDLCREAVQRTIDGAFEEEWPTSARPSFDVFQVRNGTATRTSIRWLLFGRDILLGGDVGGRGPVLPRSCGVESGQV